MQLDGIVFPISGQGYVVSPALRKNHCCNDGNFAKRTNAMKIDFNNKKRSISVGLVLALLAGLVLLKPSGTEAIPIPPTFVATLVQALPAIGTVVKNLFSPTDKKTKPTPAQTAAITSMTKESEDGKKQLAAYAKREQVIWRIVTAPSQTSRGVSIMIAIASDKPDLTEDEIAELNADLTFIKQGVDSVVASKPDLSLFGSDAVQLTAIQDLVMNAPPLVVNISNDLKYNPTKKNAMLIKLLHQHLQQLDRIFTDLDKATAAEIQMIADGLSAVSAPTPPAPTDKNAIKLLADKNTKSAFGNVSALDSQIRLSTHELDEALQKFEKRDEKF
jgi:hypothetical protein